MLPESAILSRSLDDDFSIACSIGPERRTFSYSEPEGIRVSSSDVLWERLSCLRETPDAREISSGSRILAVHGYDARHKCHYSQNVKLGGMNTKYYHSLYTRFVGASLV